MRDNEHEWDRPSRLLLILVSPIGALALRQTRLQGGRKGRDRSDTGSAPLRHIALTPWVTLTEPLSLSKRSRAHFGI